MIGSILFYGLYPLTRFINRVSDTLRKGPSSAFINGGEMCDGEGGFATRKFTKTQTALLGQWLSAGGPLKAKRETGKETGEEVKEGEQEMEETKKVKMEGRPAMEEEKMMKPEKSKLQSVTKDETGGSGELLEEQVREEAPRHEDEKKTILSGECDMDLLRETMLVSIKESTNSDLTQECLLKTTEPQICKQNSSVVDHMIEKSWTSCLDLQTEQFDTEVSETPNKHQVQEEKSDSQTQVSAIKEYWDDYNFAGVGEQDYGTCDPEMDLVSMLSEAHSQARESQSQPQQTGWHFPIGPGLGEVAYCPAWPLPSMSYYPTLQTTMPFEVMWRVWETVRESPTAADPLQGACPDSQAVFDFTVMSYNILAQDLLEAHPNLYTHCPLEVLQWDYRLHNLVQEFQKWEPDILCLQEVQEDHYKEHLEPVLCGMGYACVFKRRTGSKTDGCSICYRSELFSELSVSLLEFFRPDCELLDRDNVGIVLLLQPVITRGSEVTAKGPPLCVANTHLLFNPRRGDVKLAQLAIVLAKIDRLVESCRARGDLCNVVLCGDFNCVPNMPLYQLITTGQLHYHGLPVWMLSGQEDRSYQVHHHRLFAPPWPSSLGITDQCQYARSREEPEGVQYSHDFMLQLRFCEAAVVRPQDLEMIPGVTDCTPDPEEKRCPAPSTRFRQTISHSLNLRSVYRHVIPGTDLSEVTTLHTEAGATVDYIFYTAGPDPMGDHKGGGQLPGDGLKLISRLSLLSEQDLWSMKGIPNDIYPSDHLCLLARFQLDLCSV